MGGGVARHHPHGRAALCRTTVPPSHVPFPVLLGSTLFHGLGPIRRCPCRLFLRKRNCFRALFANGPRMLASSRVCSPEAASGALPRVIACNACIPQAFQQVNTTDGKQHASSGPEGHALLGIGDALLGCRTTVAACSLGTQHALLTVACSAGTASMLCWDTGGCLCWDRRMLCWDQVRDALAGMVGWICCTACSAVGPEHAHGIAACSAGIGGCSAWEQRMLCPGRRMLCWDRGCSAGRRSCSAWDRRMLC